METIYRNVNSIDWITAVILGSFFLLVLGKHFYKSLFFNFIILPFNNKYIGFNNKKGKLFNWFHIILSLFQLLNFSLFIYLIKGVFFSENIGSIPIFFFIALGLLIFYLLIKIAIQMLNAFVFDANDLISGLILSKISYFNYSSLVAFLANIILTYILQSSKIVIFVSIFCIFLINSIGIVNLLRNYQKLISINLLYFILYLCALEIAPVVIIGSFVKD